MVLLMLSLPVISTAACWLVCAAGRCVISWVGAFCQCGHPHLRACVLVAHIRAVCVVWCVTHSQLDC
jgi:hypothetical protein